MTPFYGPGDPAAAGETLHRALELGIDFLDTSDAYAQGANEASIAGALQGRRDRYVIASKFGNLRAADGSPTADGQPAYVRRACEASLRRLSTDRIDLYFIHRVDPTVPIEDTVGAMSELVRQGKVRHIGISEAGPQTIRRAHATHPLAAVQTEYSLLTRDVEAAVLGLCDELGIGFVAYSPLARGLLTGTIGAPEQFDATDIRRRLPRFQGANLRHNLDLVAELRALAAGERCTPAQLALAWVLGRGPGIVPIASTAHAARLAENAAAATLTPSAATLQALQRIFAPGVAAGARYGEAMLRRVGL